MEHWLARTLPLLGQAGLEELARRRLAVLGLGGVGGSAAEALLRSGAGHLMLIDRDVLEETNLNRQLLATRPKLGLRKAAAAKERLASIWPECDIDAREEFFLPGQDAFLWEWQPDFVIDAVDNITAKLCLIEGCRQRQIPLVVCLGTGGRLDPSQLRYGTLAETAGCGCQLARVLRSQLRRRGIPPEEVPVVYSLEAPVKAALPGQDGRRSPASSAFVPPAAGLLAASVAVRRLTGR